MPTNQLFTSALGVSHSCRFLSSARLITFSYNSAVFLDVAVQDYRMYITNATNPFQISFLNQNESIVEANFKLIIGLSCQQIYEHSYVFGNGDVVVVVPSSSQFPVAKDDGGWINISVGDSVWWGTMPSSAVNSCISNILPDGSLSGPSQLEVSFTNVTSCYTESRNEGCTVRFSIPILLIVIVCNLGKALCMFLTAWGARDATLVTLGDAIASFLESTDDTTKHVCLDSKIGILK